MPDVIKQIRTEVPGAKFTDAKAAVVTAVLLEWETPMVDEAMAHLDSRVWELSFFNTEIIGAKEWRKDYCPRGCVGQWSKFLANTKPEIPVAAFRVLCTRFRLALGQGEPSRREVQQARPKRADIERAHAAMALAHNWLLPMAEQQEPRILDDLRQRVADGRLEDELSQLAVARGNAGLASTLVLNTSPSAAALLQKASA